MLQGTQQRWPGGPCHCPCCFYVASRHWATGEPPWAHATFGDPKTRLTFLSILPTTQDVCFSYSEAHRVFPLWTPLRKVHLRENLNYCVTALKGVCIFNTLKLWNIYTYIQSVMHKTQLGHRMNYCQANTHDMTSRVRKGVSVSIEFSLPHKRPQLSVGYPHTCVSLDPLLQASPGAELGLSGVRCEWSLCSCMAEWDSTASVFSILHNESSSCHAMFYPI